MKPAYLKKVESRLARLSDYFGDEARVRRMLYRAVPNISPRDASNRANDLIRLLADGPRLLTIIQELKDQRTALRRVIREMNMNVTAPIVELEDSNGLGPWDNETPAHRED